MAPGQRWAKRNVHKIYIWETKMVKKKLHICTLLVYLIAFEEIPSLYHQFDISYIKTLDSSACAFYCWYMAVLVLY